MDLDVDLLDRVDLLDPEVVDRLRKDAAGNGEG